MVNVVLKEGKIKKMVEVIKNSWYNEITESIKNI